MKVYALVGKSGTGKSYQAMNLCKEKDIESIIDDGLYIYKANALAGVSAKRQATKIGAIKTALFSEDSHRDEVVKAINETNPDSLLIIGTSDGMVNKINKRLELKPIDEMVHIESITTQGEREIAFKQRTLHGKHVVPAPAFQLKRQFSGFFMDPLGVIKGWGFGKETFAEKSVVRPTFSYLGDFIISDRVIGDIAQWTAEEVAGVDEVLRIIIEKREDELSIKILANFDKNYSTIEVGRKLQTKSAKMLEEMTAFSIGKIDVEVKGFI